MIVASVTGRLMGQARNIDGPHGQFVEREMCAAQLDGSHPRLRLIARAGGSNAIQLERTAEGERVEIRGQLSMGVWQSPSGPKPRGTVRLSDFRVMRPKGSERPADALAEPMTASPDGHHGDAHGSQQDGANAHFVAAGRGSVQVPAPQAHGTVPTISVQQTEHSL